MTFFTQLWPPIDAAPGNQHLKSTSGGYPSSAPRAVALTGETGTETKPVIVLGFTTPSWRDGTLKKWAQERRREDLKNYNDDYSFIKRRRAATDELKKVEHDWESQTIGPIAQRFRDQYQLRPHGEGPRGFAFAFPGFRSRKRCVVCLCSTEFHVLAEQGEGLEGSLELGKLAPKDLEERCESCAEVEESLVVVPLLKKGWQG